jgi:hypothetical protein
MSINLLKKLVSSVVQPEIVRPTQRKPPQRVHTVAASPNQPAKLSDGPLPEFPPQNRAEKILIPATWNELIGNPRVWAEVRPLIVDED